MRSEFTEAIRTQQANFDLRLSDGQIERLAGYYEIVRRHNPLLHLVAPAPPEEFAVRHILESLTLLEYLPGGARLADVGTGAGLPSIPCLLVRDDLAAVLIESKLKKARFLEEVLQTCGLEDRASIINRQFEEIKRPAVGFVTCRALDKFTQKLPKLLKWAGEAGLLFFGGPALGDELRRRGVRCEEKLMPLSEKRFLFIALPAASRA